MCGSAGGLLLRLPGAVLNPIHKTIFPPIANTTAAIISPRIIRSVCVSSTTFNVVFLQGTEKALASSVIALSSALTSEFRISGPTDGKKAFALTIMLLSVSIPLDFCASRIAFIFLDICGMILVVETST